MKNILILGFLTLMTMAYAKDPVQKESMDPAISYKVEKAVKEKSAGRAFAGAKAKKEKVGDEVPKDEIPSSDDSEVRYWRYSE